MVDQAEVDALKSTFKDVLREVQPFERCLADSRTLGELASVAQRVIYEGGYKRGYDWRCIHVRVKIVNSTFAYIDPHPLNEHAIELVERAMTE